MKRKLSGLLAFCLIINLVISNTVFTFAENTVSVEAEYAGPENKEDTVGMTEVTFQEEGFEAEAAPEECDTSEDDAEDRCEDRGDDCCEVSGVDCCEDRSDECCEDCCDECCQADTEENETVTGQPEEETEAVTPDDAEATAPDETETAAPDEAETATPSDAEAAASGNAEKEESEKTVLTATAEDGMTVVLEADPGVFPEGVILCASVVEGEEAETAQQEIEETAENENITKTVTYDICVMLDGEEVEPDNEKGSVQVSFIIPEAPCAAETANIYHHAEDGLEVVLEEERLQVLKTEDLENAEESDEVLLNAVEGAVVLTAEVESFSLYTVTFAYSGLTASVEPQTEVALSSITSKLGITKTVVNAYMAAGGEAYVNVYEEDDAWKLMTLKDLDAGQKLVLEMADDSIVRILLTDASAGDQTAVIRNYADHTTANLRNSSLLEVYTEGFSYNATLKYSYSFTNTTTKNSGAEFYASSDLTVTEGGTTGKVISKANKGNWSFSRNNYKYFAVMPHYASTDYEYASLTVQVTVEDVNLNSETYQKKATAAAGGFGEANLGADVQNMHLILYVDETQALQSMYGLSGIAHITCYYSDTVTEEKNDNVIKVESTTGKLEGWSKNKTYYRLTGLKMGESVFSATVSKQASCTFHPGKSGACTTAVLVVNRPGYEYDSENGTLTITNITPGLTYTVNGEEQTAPEEAGEDDELVFKDIKPESTYVITLSETGKQEIQKAGDPVEYPNYKREFAVTTGEGHLHHMTYSASGATVTAKCDGGEGSACTEPIQTMTISASDASYDGTAKSAGLDRTKIGPYSPVIMYTGTGTTVYTASAAAPVNVGTYRAGITVGPSDNEVTVYADFEITKAAANKVTVTVPASKPYDGKPQQAATAVADFGTPEIWYKDALGNESKTVPTAIGEYTVIVKVEETANYPGADIISEKKLIITKAAVATPSKITKYFTGEELTSDFSDGDQYTVKNQAKGTDAGIYYAVLTLKNAGTYAWKNSDAADAQAVFEIAKAAANTLTPGTVPSDKTYDGKAAAAATASTAFGKVQIRYIGINGTSYDSENPPAGAGQYKIIAWADGTANYPAAAETQIGTFTISKANVTVPSGIRKAYTGSEQISDFQAGDHYTVKSQAKGTKAGKYQAVLTLKDPANYCWTGSSLADASVTFEITKAAPNAITSGTVPGDKTYDGAAVPVATASSVYGPVKIRYVGIGGTSYSSENPPAAAGQYKAVAWVEATDDYAGVEDTDLGTFTIAMADVATPSGVTRTYNGADQTSDIEDCAQYTVTAQASGRNAGEYTATVTLTDPDNCKWADGTAGAVYHPVMTILPAVVEEPVIADKVYSGIRQKAYFEKELFTEGESTILVSDGNTGWIGEQDEICSYPFEMKLDSNHVWKGTGTDTAEFIFRIIPDPMDDVERSQEDKARGETYTSGLATIKVYTERKNGAPSTYIQNMNLALAYSLLSPEEQAAYDNGENIAIEVRLEVRPKAKEEIEKNDADAITEQVGKLTNGSLGIYLDLTLWKDVSISNGPVNTNQLHDTDPSVLRVRVTVPEELRRENRTYYVARSHDNAGTILFTEKVADTCIDLDFETDKFSIYAILYTEPVEKETETGDERTCWWKADDHG